MTEKLRLQAAADTDVGLFREVNQDTAYAWVSGADLKPARALLILADGMGGHKAGDVASQLAVEHVGKVLEPLLLEDNENIIDWADMVTKAVKQANAAIFNYAIEHDINPRNIGTTLECVVVFGNKAYLAHIGDSRAYILGRVGLEQLTNDHSAVGELVQAGVLNPSEVYTHPQRNILTRALGGDINFELDVMEFSLRVGERLMLCSDGLWGMVFDDALEDILLKAASPFVLIGELIEAAKEGGGDDNISVVICDIMP